MIMILWTREPVGQDVKRREDSTYYYSKEGLDQSHMLFAAKFSIELAITVRTFMPIYTQWKEYNARKGAVADFVGKGSVTLQLSSSFHFVHE